MTQGILQLIVFLSSLLVGSAGDALDDKEGGRFGHALKATEIGILVMSPFIINPEYVRVLDILAYGVSYTSLRIALFDPLYNLFHGNPINYMGTKSWWDRWFSKRPVHGRWFTRGIALIVGIGLSLIGIL